MLTLKNKGPVRFEWSDALSESAVILQPDDDSGVIRAKLQRVLELEDGQGLPVRAPGAALKAAKEDFPPLFDAETAEAAVLAQGAMGWTEDADLDSLPEA